MSRPIIEVQNLSKKYRLGVVGATTLREDLSRLFGRTQNTADQQGEFWALRDVSFQVARGEVVGIIGRNGAGKSTLLKILSRITEPTAGRVVLRGRVASLLEVGTGFHPDLTGRENVYLNGAILGMKQAEISARFDEIVAFCELATFIDTPVKHYSSGMRVRLAFAVAAHLESEILIVDEVLAVGDHAFQQRCFQKIDSLTTSGRTILMVSHQAEMIQRLCNRGILLKNGGVHRDGTPTDALEAYHDSNEHERSRYTRIAPVNGPAIISAQLEPLHPNAGIPFRDPVTLRVRIRGWAQIQAPALALQIVSSTGVKSLHAWTMPPATPAGDEPDVELVGYFPTLRLMPGSYWMHLHLSAYGGTRKLDVVNEALQFRITPPLQRERYAQALNPANGVYAEDIRWSVETPATNIS